MTIMYELTLIAIPERVGTVRNAERLRAKFVDPSNAVVRDGIRYWRLSDGTERVIPTGVYKDAYVVCPAIQQDASDEASAKVIDAYVAARAKHGYSDEERFEMRAAFGPDTEIVDALTGEKIQL